MSGPSEKKLEAGRANLERGRQLRIQKPRPPQNPTTTGPRDVTLTPTFSIPAPPQPLLTEPIKNDFIAPPVAKPLNPISQKIVDDLVIPGLRKMDDKIDRDIRESYARMDAARKERMELEESDQSMTEDMEMDEEEPKLPSPRKRHPRKRPRDVSLKEVKFDDEPQKKMRTENIPLPDPNAMGIQFQGSHPFAPLPDFSFGDIVRTVGPIFGGIVLLKLMDYFQISGAGTGGDGRKAKQFGRSSHPTFSTGSQQPILVEQNSPQEGDDKFFSLV